ncbi:protein NDNF-like isoform X1 [Chrysemys picta bellii]|uniref:protein NDNF-like isoform X1 n=1 Tax=Chrysemys picta bellii TaxID=8478 RepID=UPI0032B252AE
MLFAKYHLNSSKSKNSEVLGNLDALLKVLKMFRFWIYLPFHLLVAMCLCHSIKVPTSSQHSFKSDLFNCNHSLILVDGKETTVHLLKDIPKRYCFILEEDRAPAPFTVTVTPCDVPIEWSILVHKASTNFLGKAARGDYDTLEATKSQKIPKLVSMIFNYKGNSVETYMGMSSYSAFYMLEFLSIERDTHITVYLTTDTTSGHLYPELPLDPRIDVIGIGHATVTLAWKHSPSVLKHKENIQYCLLVNEKHNYKSLCAAETAIRSSGMKSPPALALSLFPYLLDHQQVMILSNSELSIINRVSNGEVRQICMGTKNTYTVPNLRPSTQYYFDVFVVNLLTNASAAYTGTFARTLEEPEPKVIELKDGKVIHLTLDGKKQKFYSLQYQARHKKIQFIFQSCSGHVGVQITRNGKVLASENIAGFRHFSLKGKLLDTYLVQLRSMDHTNSSVKVQVSSHFHKPFFPLLPESLKIKSFSKLRTCNSVTIAWLGTQEQSKYCVYKKRIKEDQVWMEVRSADRCSGPKSRHNSEKVLCKYFYDINLRRAVTTQTIKGLEAGTLYLFDVYLTEPSGIPVRYHSKVVKTRKKC